MTRSIPFIALLLGTCLLISCKPDSAERQANNEPTTQQQPINRVITPEGAISASPLPAHKADTKGKKSSLFTAINPEDSGIGFVNPILGAHPKNYLYASAMGCGGIAVGDINNDGLPDLFLTGGPVGNKLYLQTDQLVFRDATKEAGVAGDHAWATGAAIIDIDNDGDLDIYVCNYDVANSLYINNGNGNGSFTESAKAFKLDLVAAGHTPAFCDFNLDGHLDLYLMTNFFYDPRGKTNKSIAIMGKDGKPTIHPDYSKFYGITDIKPGDTPGAIRVDWDTVGQSDFFLENNGNGTFSRINQPGQLMGKGNTAIWWDPDGDGRPDLYVANDFEGADFFLKNTPQGTMENTVESAFPHITWFSMGADSADLNGDGLPDLMVADMSGTNHFKQKIGMGAMSDNAEFLATAFPRQYMRNTVFINTGTSRFMEAAHMSGLANSDWTWTVRLSDFDNDGKVDVFLTNGMAVNLNVADNPETSKVLPGETEWDKHVRAGTGPLKEQNLAFRNLGNLNFENVSKSWGLDHVGMSYAATAADLDRDGDLELIVTNLDEPVSIYRNDSGSENRLIIDLLGIHSNSRGIGATIRVKTQEGEQLRFVTLSRGYMACGEATTHFGLGKEDNIIELSVKWPSGHLQVFKDLKANQHFTITEPGKEPGAELQNPPEQQKKTLFTPLASSLTNIKHNETLFDDFERQPLLPQKLSQLGPGMAWGDVDGDGDHDVYIAGARNKPGHLMRNDGKGDFLSASQGAWSEDTAHEDMAALFFDSDGDGDLDLYVVSGGVECNPGDPVLQDRIYLNDGKGLFTKATKGTLPEMHDSGSVVNACDFDRDGDLDLFVGGRVIPGRYPLPPKSHLLRNDNGKFTDVTEALAPGLSKIGMVTGAIWSDADNDQINDLLITCEWGPVRFFRNAGGKLENRTSEAGLYNHWGWWNGIVGSDIDNDGDIDYAVTNFGLNTKYHASMKKPTRIFYGDFGEKGESRVVEAEYENDILYPVRGRSCSSHAMPFLFDKFETFRGFASASLTDIYTPKTLSKSTQFAATELQSSILINDGKGKFRFQALPRIVQIAPGFGLDFCDFNGDGNIDLYILQNFHGPQAETGHMAGGVSQLLQGDGSGQFTPIRPDLSGLVASGDAKSLTQTDLDGDGWTDFILGINNDRILAFRNNNKSSNRPVTIRLLGKAGNPQAIGSRITITLDNGRTSIAEVRAGAGYLSQNPPDCTFGLAENRQIAAIHILWPNGIESTVNNPQTLQIIKVTHPHLAAENR